MQDPNEDTEWNDILRAHGILPERPQSPTRAIEDALDDALEKAYARRLEGKTLEELDELDELGLEDEEFIQTYREKRMREIQEQLSKEKFGQVVHISKPEYQEVVTEASASVPVVLHISSSESTQSKLLSALLDRVAPRFRDIKFVDIDCRQINERYPMKNCPTILVYKDKAIAHQLETLNTIGGNSTNLHDIDRLLVKFGLVDESDCRLLVNADDNDENS